MSLQKGFYICFVAKVKITTYPTNTLIFSAFSMSYLFISRKNVHVRYYKNLISLIGVESKIHIMGAPRIGAFRYLFASFKLDLRELIECQLRRKQARNKIWFNPFAVFLYTCLLNVVERCRYAKYVDLFTVKNPDAVVIWNGNKLPNKTVSLAAKNMKFKVFYFENGLLPGTTSLDPHGVNYAAAITRDPNFYLNFDPNNKYPFIAPELIPRKQHKKRAEFSSVKLPEHYIFVPFQVPHDTQMASFSPWIKSMEMLYDAVIKAVEALGDPNLKVIFKEHPSWHVHYTALYDKSDLGIFANCNETQELIQNAKAVITVNSSVGLESLLLSKKVITVGQSCYNLDGLVLHASEQEALLQCLVDIQQGWQLDLNLRDKFFSYLKHVYTIEGRWQDCSKDHAKAVEERLLGIDAFSQQINNVKDNNEGYSNLSVAE